MLEQNKNVQEYIGSQKGLFCREFSIPEVKFSKYASFEIVLVHACVLWYHVEMPLVQG